VEDIALAPPPFDDPRRSCRRLVEWAEPLLDDSERALSLRSAETFLENDGPLLQRELERIRKEDGDDVLRRVPYWEGWYLSSREPLPVYFNPFYIFEEDSLPREKNPFRLAARLALAAAAFCLDIDRGLSEADRMRGEPLCMRQYASVFRSSRSAGSPCDSAVSGDRNGIAGRSALVLSRGNLFLVELISTDGELRDLDETAHSLETVSAEAPSRTLPVGLITCPNRNEAVRGRRMLLESEKKNELLLSLAEKALFALRLDAPCGSSIEDAARHFLFDEGKNAWYEKSFQLIVTGDCRAGINFEHSARDGTHMGRLVKEILGRAPGIQGRAGRLAAPVSLSFHIPPQLGGFLEDAERNCRRLSRKRRQIVLSFSAFGREAIKKAGMGPDAFVQAALLFAAKRVRGEWRSAYESVHMRRFKGGRTEGTRPLTPEAATFLDALQSGGRDRSVLRPLLLAAGAAHRRRIEECLAGRGVEGHLGLLREIWRSEGARLGIPAEPDLFSSPAWRKLTSCFVSSSTTSGEGIALAGYGPVQQGGLSARYLSKKDRFTFHIASWAEDGPLGEHFSAALHDALMIMGDIL
jgi:hypothetical protein